MSPAEAVAGTFVYWNIDPDPQRIWRITADKLSGNKRIIVVAHGRVPRNHIKLISCESLKPVPPLVVLALAAR